MKYRFRDYQDSDYEKVMELWESTGLSNPQRGDNKALIRKTLNMGGHLVVMESKSGEPIGTSWITNDGRRLYLHHFGIKPGYQGKGLSKPLLEKSLEIAKKEQMQIKLEVHKDNEAALKLYKRYGFGYLGDYLVFIVRDVNKV